MKKLLRNNTLPEIYNKIQLLLIRFTYIEIQFNAYSIIRITYIYITPSKNRFKNNILYIILYIIFFLTNF